MQAMRITYHSNSIKLIAVLLVVATCGVVLAYYGWQTVTIPIQIKEPVEALSYPSQLSLYPGETLDFNVTIKNDAPINYSVALEYYLSNVTYQSKYVTFDNEVYTVYPGQQNLATWLKVETDAIPMSDTLTVQIVRLANAQYGTEQLTVQKIQWTPMTGFTIYVNNTGTKTASINQILVNYVGVPGSSVSPKLPITMKSGTGITQAFAVTFAYTNGTNYDISVVTSDGYKFTSTFQGGVNSG